MRTISWLGLVFLCLVGSACGAKVVVDAPSEGAGGGGGGSGPSTCTSGEVETCYGGPPGTAGVGICKEGSRVCQASGTFGECVADLLPSSEICGNGVDEDCNGIADDPASCNGDCVGCAQYVSDGNPSAVLCPSSKPVYDTLFACLCAGKCAVSCSASYCVGSDPGQSCIDCAVAGDGCGNEFNACAVD
ncbi:hypothetical protein [Polyangium sp. 6x1]|uniref:hypothetical protein n=1 Tax=Polyangium sp. 6x1 TaxID=3042689 RepID=UPI002482EB6E|nr:hypothetical protein [Polyangium sp. 6x1]MDI1450747.1 hypothetical protein [Polyangium sp. 6x1]